MATSSLPDRDLSQHRFPELRRTRSVTTFAAAHYEERVERYVTRLLVIRRSVDSILLDIDSSQHMSLDIASEISGELSHHMEQYNRISDEYISYLNGQRTRYADHEATEHFTVANELRLKVSSALKKLQPKRDTIPEVRSIRSSTVTKTSDSHLTSVLLKHTAKVEEAKIKLQYAQEEASLMRREAELRAQKSTLKIKQELDIAESSLNAVKQVLEFTSTKDECSERSHPSYVSKRTTDFVQDQRACMQPANYHGDAPIVAPIHKYDDIPVTKAPRAPPPPVVTQLNPNARQFVPDSTQTKLDNTAVAKFLAKKHLLTSR
ncbi:uncharacterized protein LOC110465052 [Mizuhopecten yessoensis]|uniref:uncharacterized protein LOC110465052 n=1 Tax=Mizuhopecten yessoensis TaxID=6573 RepID=UPI000B45DCE5|nr:uncharacterized protein LOC110465052 [Mizuhopecten yessoensis]